ncbi:MAG: cytochrome c oxidase subunit 3 [Anaerolineales bacterium]|jgi:cytochrome c oxidase subunit 3
MRTAVEARRRDEGLAKTGLLAVLASEAVFFGTLLTAYLFLRLSQPNWPLQKVGLSQLVVPGLNTGILLLSALVISRANRAIARGDRQGLQARLLLVVLLGAVFIAGQLFEFLRLGLRPGDQAFGGVFFTLMGFHALHVVAGMVIVILAYLRARLGDFSAHRHIAVQVSAWFWYFVTAVWVVMFLGLYVV